MTKEIKTKNNQHKVAKKANNGSRKGRTPSFTTFVRKVSHGIYQYDKKRNVIRIKDDSVWRDAKEDGIYAKFLRDYVKAYPAK
jgi:hypothetical protein